jgi:hypothetical protein
MKHAANRWRQYFMWNVSWLLQDYMALYPKRDLFRIVVVLFSPWRKTCWYFNKKLLKTNFAKYIRPKFNMISSGKTATFILRD